MTEMIKKIRKTRKQGNTYLASLPKEVIQALSLNEKDKLAFVIHDGQVSLKKPLTSESDNVPNEFYDDIDFFMDKHNQAFKNLIEK